MKILNGQHVTGPNVRSGVQVTVQKSVRRGAWSIEPASSVPASCFVLFSVRPTVRF
jgi:hypothetical protein